MQKFSKIVSGQRPEGRETDYGRKRIIKRHRKDVQCFCINGQQGNE